MPSEIFYGKEEGPMNAKEIALARSVCNKCDVKTDCLITSLKTEEPFGVWGGYTSFERKAALLRNKGNVQASIDDHYNKVFVTPRKRKK
jgi:WhiB family redox-sensing transcriptional regulator